MLKDTFGARAGAPERLQRFVSTEDSEPPRFIDLSHVSTDEGAKREIYRLNVWEEYCGRLNMLETDGEILHLAIGKVALALPVDMVDKLRPCLGRRIAVLRTDLPDRLYLVRVISESDANCVSRMNSVEGIA